MGLMKLYTSVLTMTRQATGSELGLANQQNFASANLVGCKEAIGRLLEVPTSYSVESVGRAAALDGQTAAKLVMARLEHKHRKAAARNETAFYGEVVGMLETTMQTDLQLQQTDARFRRAGAAYGLQTGATATQLSAYEQAFEHADSMIKF